MIKSSAVHVLFATSLADGRHCSHQKMIRVRSERVKCLLEADLDLEAISIDSDHVDGVKRSQRCHEDHSSSGRVFNENKTHELSYRPPQEIDAEV